MPLAFQHLAERPRLGKWSQQRDQAPPSPSEAGKQTAVVRRRRLLLAARRSQQAEAIPDRDLPYASDQSHAKAYRVPWGRQAQGDASRRGHNNVHKADVEERLFHLKRQPSSSMVDSSGQPRAPTSIPSKVQRQGSKLTLRLFRRSSQHEQDHQPMESNARAMPISDRDAAPPSDVIFHNNQAEYVQLLLDGLMSATPRSTRPSASAIHRSVSAPAQVAQVTESSVGRGHCDPVHSSRILEELMALEETNARGSAPIPPAKPRDRRKPPTVTRAYQRVTKPRSQAMEIDEGPATADALTFAADLLEETQPSPATFIPFHKPEPALPSPAPPAVQTDEQHSDVPRPMPQPKVRYRVAYQEESGSLFTSVMSYLCSHKGWRCFPLPPKATRYPDKTNGSCRLRAHLMLGTKYAIERHVQEWKAITGYPRDPPFPFGTNTLVNYYVGSQCLTLKAQMVRTLRDCYSDPHTITPPTFIIYPQQGAADEREEFFQTFAKNEQGPMSNIWIAKSSHGCKGNGIRLFKNAAAALAYVDSSQEPFPYVLQQYLDPPFLIAGRKFDIRTWVLVTPNFDIYMYREGVCRTSSEPYSTTNLDQTLAHLTNHCLQEKGPNYSIYEKGNEMWFDDFQTYLDRHHPGLHFRRHAVPHIKDIVRRSLLSLHGRLVTSQQRSRSRLSCFQVFGFDFMLDASFHVWLIEVNGSPAVANHLLPKFTADLVHLVIDPIFSSQGTAERHGLTHDIGFELVHAAENSP